MKDRDSNLSSECRILIVDDEKNLCEVLKEALKERYLIDTCYSTNEAFLYIKKQMYDVVVTDLKLGDGSGIEVLKFAKGKDRFVEVIIITGYGTLETASEAINLGVSSYLNKPLKLNEFVQQVERAVYARVFHLKSLKLLANPDSGSFPEAKEHIYDITSLYYFATKLMYHLDISEAMKIILHEVNEKLEAKFSVIGIDYLNYHEIFAMPRSGEIRSADVMDAVVSVWDSSIKMFVKDDLKTDQVSCYVYHGKEVGENDQNDNKTFGQAVTLPMTVLGETIGYIAVFKESMQPLSKERNEFFTVFTSLISSAVQHGYVDMLAKLQAKTDSLTGVANHRMFHETLERELARAKRYKRQFCLAIIDIDNFKNINDTYGHLVGDSVLVDLTKRVLKVIRCGDVLARYGGEEFGLILPDTVLSGAEILAGRVCEIISETPFMHADAGIKYTVSIGVVAYNYETSPLKNEMIKSADEALYQAKKEGKNRVVVNRD